MPLTKKVRVVFPTEEAIVGSHLGIEGTGCIRLPKKTWDKPTFPRSLFYALEEKAEGHRRNVHHTKCWIVNEGGSEVNDKTVIYVGSHNFSPSAWGNMEKNGVLI